jgi:spore coat polysaccharide biosynthesis protein SpsF
MSSKRLPGKVLLSYKNYNILKILVTRLKEATNIKKIIVATSKNKADNQIINFCKKNKILFYRGSEEDVLSRYYEAANSYNLKTIVQ